MKLEYFSTVEQVREQLDAYGKAIGIVTPENYHAWKSKLGIPCVSKSSLVDFMENPYRYHFEKEHGVGKDSEALRKGSLIDCLTLTPGIFDQCYAIDDSSRNSKTYKERAAQLNPLGISLIKTDEYADAKAAADAATTALRALCGEPRRDAELFTADGELAEVPEYTDGYLTQVGMWVRLESIGSAKLDTPLIVSGMLDVLPLEYGMPLIDLKSTSVELTSPYALNKNIADFGYGIQAAMYADLYQECSGEERGFLFLFVSTKSGSQTRVVRVDDGTMYHYRSVYSLALMDYARCCAKGEWGEQHLPEMTYQMPTWEARKGVEV